MYGTSIYNYAIFRLAVNIPWYELTKCSAKRAACWTARPASQNRGFGNISRQFALFGQIAFNANANFTCLLNILEQEMKNEMSYGNREMHKATCADCGKECDVPFKP